MQPAAAAADLDQAQGLVDAAADGEVVHGDLLQVALGVDDVERTQRDAFVLDEAAVLGGDELGQVRHDRDLHVAQAALVARQAGPRQVALGRVHRRRNHLRVERLELGRAVAERDDLGRAHVRKVLGVEEEHDVFAAVLLERHVDNVAVDDRGRRERRRRLADARHGQWVLDERLVLVFFAKELVVVVVIARVSGKEALLLLAKGRGDGRARWLLLLLRREGAADKRIGAGTGHRRTQSGGGRAQEGLQGGSWAHLDFVLVVAFVGIPKWGDSAPHFKLTRDI